MNGIWGSMPRNVPRVIAQSAVPVTVTGVVTETIAKSITIPGGLLGPDGALLIELDLVCTNSVNTKFARIWGNGVAGNQFLGQDLTNRAAFRQSVMVINKGTAAAQLSTSWSGYAVSSSDYHVERTVDTSQDWTLDIVAGLTNAADSMTLKYYSVLLMRA